MKKEEIDMELVDDMTCYSPEVLEVTDESRVVKLSVPFGLIEDLKKIQSLDWKEELGRILACEAETEYNKILKSKTVTCPKCNETWDYKDTAVTRWCSKCGKLAPLKSLALSESKNESKSLTITELKKLAEKQLAEYHATQSKIAELRNKRKKPEKPVTQEEADRMTYSMDPGRVKYRGSPYG